MDQIQLERTWNYELVRSVITHPRLYPHIASDFHPSSRDFSPNESDAIHYLVARQGEEILGLCITHWIHTPITWELHHAILPSAWNRTTAIGAAFERWVFEQTPCETAVGFVPACNPLSIRYALRMGWEQTGCIPKGYKRNHTRYDIIILSKERYKTCHLQQQEQG